MVVNHLQEVKNKLSTYPAQMNSSKLFIIQLRNFMSFQKRKIDYGALSSNQILQIIQLIPDLTIMLEKSNFSYFLKTILYFTVSNNFINRNKKKTLSSITYKNQATCLSPIETAEMNSLLAIKDCNRVKMDKKIFLE